MGWWTTTTKEWAHSKHWNSVSVNFGLCSDRTDSPKFQRFRIQIFNWTFNIVEVLSPMFNTSDNSKSLISSHNFRKIPSMHSVLHFVLPLERKRQNRFHRNSLKDTFCLVRVIYSIRFFDDIQFVCSWK